MGIDEVAAAVRTANTNLPTGILYGRHRAFTVETTGQLNRAKEFNPIIISFRSGHPVRLQDVGKPSTAWRSTRPRRGLLISERWFWLFNVSREPTLWKWRMP